ncbi:MAG: hypothetical protein K9N49_04650 [Candidatus Marinimicrobia bacterium]|nr:hypothetical protein [Candidatus Neomarinimicrobiota bacterium]
MKIEAVIEKLGCEVAQAGTPEREVTTGYTSDLLSDVMAHAPEGALLLTIQAHQNAVAVAALAGLTGLLLCHARPAPADLLAKAAQEGLWVLRTPQTAYEASWRLHALLCPAP